MRRLNDRGDKLAVTKKVEAKREGRQAIHRAAEIFCYPPENTSPEAIEAWKSYHCEYLKKRCEKKSEYTLIAKFNLPFGCCSVHHKGRHMQQSRPHIICPKRLEEGGLIFQDVARVLQDPKNIYIVGETNVKGLGRFDFFLANYDKRSDKVTDFCALEPMTVSTTNTGGIIRSLIDHIKKGGIKQKYKYGINYRQVLGRMESQFFIKGKAMAQMGKHIVWTVQDVLYDYLAREYEVNIKEGFNSKKPIGMIVYTLGGNSSQGYTLRRANEYWGTLEEWGGLLVSRSAPSMENLAEQLVRKIRDQLR